MSYLVLYSMDQPTVQSVVDVEKQQYTVKHLQYALTTVDSTYTSIEIEGTLTVRSSKQYELTKVHPVS